MDIRGLFASASESKEVKAKTSKNFLTLSESWLFILVMVYAKRKGLTNRQTNKMLRAVLQEGDKNGNVARYKTVRRRAAIEVDEMLKNLGIDFVIDEKA